MYGSPGGTLIGWINHRTLHDADGGNLRPLTGAGLVETDYEQSTFIVLERRDGGWMRIRVEEPRRGDDGTVWTHACLLALGDVALRFQPWEELLTHGCGRAPEQRRRLKGGVVIVRRAGSATPRDLRLLLPAVVCVACADVTTPIDPTGPCAAPGVGTTPWDLVERGAFEFRLPPGFRDLGLPPIDSDAALYKREGDADSYIIHDFGVYTRELTDFDCAVDIGGAEARVGVRQSERGTFLFARWRDLGEVYPASEEQNALLITAETGDESLIPQLLATIHSVVFER